MTVALSGMSSLVSCNRMISFRSAFFANFNLSTKLSAILDHGSKVNAIRGAIEHIRRQGFVVVGLGRFLLWVADDVFRLRGA
ncbi:MULTISPECIES: hypothetical protein [unclassified Rhizobium]|uniref:hypothetical protein n=1 Tax=unclassified Rhizobium TaxID=2613769 RepID=UPI0015C7AD3A|nr:MULTISPECIES: hypothetical protein [unclassified Rhizobium]MDH7808778.1 hypothetical protein [Rhizobium sp. AN67]MDQ4409186.1 hypothetical protein [Rhizobium sp. AN63]